MDSQVSDGEKDRIRQIASLLYEASRPIRILKTIAWPPEVKEAFFAKKAQELPKVTYTPIDPTPTLEAVREARRSIVPISPIDLWLERQANSLELAARMLSPSVVGDNAFFEYSRQLYGEPTTPLRYFPITPLELSQSICDTIDQLAHIEMDIATPEYHRAEEVARDIERAVQNHFGEDAPKVELVDKLSANALATASTIKIRREARFTDRDASQLLNHEAYIHVTTSLNGKAQTDLPILAAGHPGTTRTQEGLAVYAEIVSGSMELDRLRRLADRVFAIQMAVEGADFLEVYRYFLERVNNRDQAFENARRVFRGGDIRGGAPFTKDVVYLFGLLGVASAIRTFFAAGRSDCLALLFCGKLDFMDIPALCELYAMGLCRAPRHLPPWVSDPRYLLSLLTYSIFMNKIEMEPLLVVANKLLESAPVVKLSRE
ncbi:flavohemoglobin expression-modulating QEGLA motif protein [Cyanothece sp. BG0011]|uniref:flavohemoglobin expression-modulating QEGLA motif protein n=1 Tax=Cyanothece sp. BG0011 TaxID=2082950 RepID=UPI000D1EF5F4|nr:flavohemoglobin expression-modulating QEGLA motif protein [Cyanothece sp. BG0011]